MLRNGKKLLFRKVDINPVHSLSKRYSTPVSKILLPPPSAIVCLNFSGLVIATPAK
jgi:hypothetical protein